MQNIQMTREGSKLILTIDLDTELGRSASGKSTLIATTAGNVDVPGAPGVKLGLNCYRK